MALTLKIRNLQGQVKVKFYHNLELIHMPYVSVKYKVMLYILHAVC
jgi:hypothetical protein